MKADIVKLLCELDLCKSMSEARRAIAQGAVRVNDKKVESGEVEVVPGDIVRIGNGDKARSITKKN